MFSVNIEMGRQYIVFTFGVVLLTVYGLVQSLKSAVSFSGHYLCFQYIKYSAFIRLKTKTCLVPQIPSNDHSL